MKNLYFTIFLLTVSTFIFAQNIKINLKPNKTELTNILNKKSGISFKATINKLVVRETKVKNLDFFKLADEAFVNNPHIACPNIPVITRLIEIPLGAEVSVNTFNIQEETINLNDYEITKQLVPVQQSVSKSEDDSQVEFAKNESIYNTNAFYGNDLVKVEILGIFRNKRIARLSISPYQYNPITNEIKVIYNFSANISFIHADYEATNKLKAKTASVYFYANDKLTLNTIENQSKDAITHYPTKMVIVADPMFETQLQDFINWKRRKGFTVIEAYTNNPDVGTTTGDIKNYLKGLYDAGTASDPAPSFVLFVGDVAQIPTFNGTTASHKTDLYYCEYTGDFFPEIYYGRWSAQNTSQLQAQIDKSLEYEQYTMPDPSYLGHNLLVAGVDQEGGDPGGFSSIHGNGQLEYGMNNYFNTAHGISVYEYLYPLSDEPVSVQNIKNDFNSGVGFTNYTAHCSSDGWANPSFLVSDVSNLTNNHKYGLMIGNCCESNTFAVNTCFGEAILRKANGGVVGYIGGSNSTYWDEDYHWGVGAQNIQADPAVNYNAAKLGAYDKAFHDHGETEDKWFVTNAAVLVGGNFAVEQANDSKHKYYWEIYHLMGDPSIMNYFGVPDALSIDYANAITTEQTTLTVTTEEYAYVAISQNNVLLDAQYTGANTSVTLSFPAFASVGTADIVVTKQNRQPHIGTIDIVETAIHNDMAVSQIIQPTTDYNCSGITVTPKVIIKNYGQDVITSVKVNYKLDNGSVVTQNWTGSLENLATATVNLADITLSVGSHTFKAYTTLPNGVSDDNTANNSKTQNIEVQDNAVVSAFSTETLESCYYPVDITFTNTSQNANSYFWDFGDSGTSTDVNPTHTYTADGVYTVKLTATDTVCGNDTEIKTDYIKVDSSMPCNYCDASSNSAQYEGITNVNFNTINNTSTNSNYTDFTSISTDINRNNQYTLSVESSQNYNTDDIFAWIDWNRNGSFNDAGEEYDIDYEYASGTGMGTIDITVPENASIGMTRMRIRLFDASFNDPSPCGATDYGEVEDYSLNILNLNSISTNVAKELFNIFPNPNNGKFIIETHSADISKIDIYTVSGELVYSNYINNNVLNIDIHGIDKGVYIVKIINDIDSQIKRIVIE